MASVVTQKCQCKSEVSLTSDIEECRSEVSFVVAQKCRVVAQRRRSKVSVRSLARTCHSRLSLRSSARAVAQKRRFKVSVRSAALKCQSEVYVAYYECLQKHRLQCRSEASLTALLRLKTLIELRVCTLPGLSFAFGFVASIRFRDHSNGLAPLPLKDAFADLWVR